MKKTSTIGLFVFLVLLVLETCYGYTITDYKEVYHITVTRKEPFSSANMNLIIYCQGGQKFRVEPEMLQETTEGDIPYSLVTIIRLDKRVIWAFDPKVKMGGERSIPNILTPISDLNMLNWPSEPEKIGEEKILGKICDICAFSEHPENKYWISREHGIILKMEQSIGSNKFFSEATDIKFESQADSLFELPADCKMVKMGNNTDEMESF